MGADQCYESDHAFARDRSETGAVRGSQIRAPREYLRYVRPCTTYLRERRQGWPCRAFLSVTAAILDLRIRRGARAGWVRGPGRATPNQ